MSLMRALCSNKVPGGREEVAWRLLGGMIALAAGRAKFTLGVSSIFAVSAAIRRAESS
jgi:hypothetical protein